MPFRNEVAVQWAASTETVTGRRLVLFVVLAVLMTPAAGKMTQLRYRSRRRVTPALIACPSAS